jgi:hypothetical protein
MSGVGNRVNLTMRSLCLLVAAALLLLLAACNKEQSASAPAAPKAFASPDEAGKALADAAKSQNPNEVLAILGPGSADLVSTGNATEDKTALAGFAQAYQAMNRWRKLDDDREVLLVGADNQAFPIPLSKKADGKWYFDVAAGKEEILARRIGHNEITAIGVCAAVANAQHQYFSQKHDGVKQYAQKFLSDAGQQNGLYWPSPEGQPRSPLGPLVAYATSEGYKAQPNQHQPFNGYFFVMLDKQGPGAKGGAKDYIVNGKMTGGFAVLAYPVQYGDSGIMSFMVDQDGMIIQRDLGKTTNEIASAMTEFDPDRSWTIVEQ